ncbi:glycoside hydrolase family 10 protein [Undibacterium sp. Ren11W]|uniref:glycoside hydrolase family 10 protein n=1 Tax=Undibacterium sp. Ren11W TaxID=3413045 RepID=UPI003BF2C9E7
MRLLSSCFDLTQNTQASEPLFVRRLSLLITVCLLLSISACTSTSSTKASSVNVSPGIATFPATTTSGAMQGLTPASNDALPPPAPREFRAAWVSTVSNLDWPSRKNLSSAQQQAEIIAILDTAVQLKLNAIVLQVRPSSDALYASELEPWSEFLTGEQGKAPKPYYDPLLFWIQQAHARGLELHAWFNPYRAKTAIGKAPATEAHFKQFAANPIKRYGDLWWLDPGEPVAMQHTLAVISDVVKRYDVDGIQLDDYFYPYPLNNAKGKELPFPDDASWGRYQQQAGKLSRADWRRENVNQLVQALQQRVRQEKSWVKFGISPFGIGRPGRMPAGIKGFSQYDQLYADVELWLERGWIDYLAPQLYWPMAQTAQSFTVLRDYWHAQNPHGRHIWPGLFTNNLEHKDKSWPVEEILKQIEASREPGLHTQSKGHVHFSITALTQNRKNIRQALSAEKYQSQALVPASPWLTHEAMAAPVLVADLTQKSLSVEPAATTAFSMLAIWKRYESGWVFSSQSISIPSISLADDSRHGALKEVLVTRINRVGQETARTSFRLN